jgi:predicted phosphodiesterase
MMPITESKATKLARDLCAQHKTLASRTLARLLHDQYPHAFTVEQARATVRRIRGNIGAEHRQKIKDKSLHEPARAHCSLKIPEGIKQTVDPLIIKDVGKHLILSDIHVPYHDKRALELAINKGVKEGCDHVYINGDFYDFHKISRFESDPGSRDPDGELELGQPILAEIGRVFRGKKRYKIGNHDYRFEAYLATNAAAIAGMKAFRLDKVLELEKMGYEYVASKQWAMMGELAILHGHEFPKGLTDPVNVGRGVYNRLGDGGLVGHWHKTSRHVETSGLKRRMTVAHSTGCLCDLRPSYAPMNRWNHGFAIVELAKNGEYNLRNFIIEKGKVFE